MMIKSISTSNSITEDKAMAEIPLNCEGTTLIYNEIH